MLVLLLLVVGCDAEAFAADPPRGTKLTWISVPAGTFEMGTPQGEECSREPAGTTPRRLESFEILAYEVTQAQFEEVMGYNPTFASNCDDCPVDSVSWHEAAAFANAIARRTSSQTCYVCSGEYEQTRCSVTKTSCDGPRIPTEAQWEYAARAGTRDATYAGPVVTCMSRDEVVDTIGWYKANSAGRPRRVGRKQPNPWGLYDVLGNVAEWSGEPRSDEHAVLRGGSWYHNAERARSGGRLWAPATRGLSYAGIRLVRPTLNTTQANPGPPMDAPQPIKGPL